MTWPAVIFWLMILAGFVSPGPAMLYVFAFSTAFGTLQMIPSDLNILPPVVAAAFLILKIILQRGNVLRGVQAAADVGQAGLFTIFVAYAALSSVVLPRLFAGQIEVVPVSGDITGTSILAPNAGNATQLGYLLLSYGCVLTFAVAGTNRGFRQSYLIAYLVLGVTLIGTGLVDLAAYTTGHDDLLDPFRNATYRLLTDAEVSGSKRVVGFTAEASVYGPNCVAAAVALAFLRPCYPTRKLRAAATGLCLGLLAMAGLSTSTSAFAGLAVFGLVYTVEMVATRRFNAVSRRRNRRIEVAALAVVGLLGLLFVIVNPRIFDAATNLVDIMVFQKSTSQSYVERTLWTRVGFAAFLDSGGVGVGYGSVRTSNWFVAMLASTGVFGTVVLFSFILMLLLRPASGKDLVAREMLKAVRLAYIPANVMYYFGGTIPDIGVWNASILGILTALAGGSVTTTDLGPGVRSSPGMPSEAPAE